MTWKPDGEPERTLGPFKAVPEGRGQGQRTGVR